MSRWWLPLLVGVSLAGGGVGCGRSPLLSPDPTDARYDVRNVDVRDAGRDVVAVDARVDGAPRPDVRVDTGSDAVRIDAAADVRIDARDSGVPDAPVRDVGVPDRGAPDAPARDATVPDRGAPDAPARDTGVPDAPVRDAGAADVRADAGSDVRADRAVPEPPIDAGAPDRRMPPEPPIDAPTERPARPDAGADGRDAGDGGACNLVDQNCPMGQRCDIAVDPTGVLGPVCEPDLGGTRPHGARCRGASSDCAPGTTCLQDVGRRGNPVGPPHCNAFCDDDGDCPAGTSCLQTTLLSGGQRLAAKICWP